MQPTQRKPQAKGEGKKLVFHTAELVRHKRRPSEHQRARKEQKCQINKQKSKEKELNNRRIIRGDLLLAAYRFRGRSVPVGERFGTKERNLRSLINVFASRKGRWMMSPITARKLSYKTFHVSSHSDLTVTVTHNQSRSSYQAFAGD